MNQRPLNRREASEYLLVKHGIYRAPATLAKLASIGGGPTFRKAKRAVIYDLAALDEFATSIISAPMRSTSDNAEVAA
jgi:hypothetical protein